MFFKGNQNSSFVLIQLFAHDCANPLDQSDSFLTSNSDFLIYI